MWIQPYPSAAFPSMGRTIGKSNRNELRGGQSYENKRRLS